MEEKNELGNSFRGTVLKSRDATDWKTALTLRGELFLQAVKVLLPMTSALKYVRYWE